MYYVQTSNDHSLDELQQIILDEELGASAFVECKAAMVKKKDGQQIQRNIMKFQEMPAGEIPEEPLLSLTPLGDVALLRWQGMMYVDGRLEGVYLYR
jgi:hypothetical protein